MSSSRDRTWISAEISPELMDSLERRAKARGISRSEGLRQALREWAADGEWDAASAEPTAEERGRRMVALLDELREEIVLRTADGSSDTQDAERSIGREATASKPADGKPGTGNAGGLEQMELYEGEDLLAWLDREDAKSREEEQRKDSPPSDTR